MTPDEERLCRPYHRTLFEKRTSGEYTFEEAAYIAKYCEFNWSLRLRNWPEWLVDLASDIHYYLHEFRGWIKGAP